MSLLDVFNSRQIIYILLAHYFLSITIKGSVSSKCVNDQIVIEKIYEYILVKEKERDKGRIKEVVSQANISKNNVQKNYEKLKDNFLSSSIYSCYNYCSKKYNCVNVTKVTTIPKIFFSTIF